MRCRVDQGDTEEAFAASRWWPGEADEQGGGVASSGACAVSLLCLLAEVGDDWHGPAQCWAGQWARWAAPGKFLSLSFSVFLFILLFL